MHSVYLISDHLRPQILLLMQRYCGLTLVYYNSLLVSNSFVRFCLGGHTSCLLSLFHKEYSLWNFMSVCVSVYKITRARLVLVVYLVTLLVPILCSENSEWMTMNSQQWYKCYYAPTSTRAVTGLLTGHNTLRRHLHLLWLLDSPLCRKCGVREELTFYVSARPWPHSDICTWAPFSWSQRILGV